MLREYDALRHEILHSMTQRTQIASFGVGAVGALWAATFLKGSPNNHPMFVLLMLNVAIPAVSVIVLVMWLGENVRARRAGAYVRDLEERINREAGDGALGWEHWLLEEGLHLHGAYLAPIVFFLLISIGAPIAGGTLASASLAATVAAIVIPVVLFGVALVQVQRTLFIGWHLKWNAPFPKPAPD